MTKTLIEVTPTQVQPIGRIEWLFSFGEPIIGREVGAANLIPGKHHYTRFKVVAWQPPHPDEEIAHFETLAQTYSPKS